MKKKPLIIFFLLQLKLKQFKLFHKLISQSLVLEFFLFGQEIYRQLLIFLFSKNKNVCDYLSIDFCGSAHA